MKIVRASYGFGMGHISICEDSTQCSLSDLLMPMLHHLRIVRNGGWLGSPSCMAFLVLLLTLDIVVGSNNVTLLVSHSSGAYFKFDNAELHSIPPDTLTKFCINMSTKQPNGVVDSCQKLASTIDMYDLSQSDENVFCLSSGGDESVGSPAQLPGDALVLEQPDGDGAYLRCFCNVKSKRDFTKFWSKYVAQLSARSSYRLVVARYQEDVSWLEEGGEMDNAIIYNKGEPLGLLNEVPLPNIGRESHAYLHFIISHYTSLPDVVAFTQADVRDHRHVLRGKTHLQHILTMKEHAAIFGKSNPHVTHYNGSTASACAGDTGADGTVTPLNLFDSNFNLEATFAAKLRNYRDNIVIPFENWFMSHIAPATGIEFYPDPMKIYPNAIFAVHKRLILQHPVAFYEALATEVAYHANPVEGHFMERSWFYIFRRQRSGL
jgi:hypothetical protein